MSIYQTFQRLKPSRHQFTSYFDAESFLEIEGFECINGAWMRGQREFAQITAIAPSMISVRIGQTIQ